jgi:GcrA cell cycle regulator
MSCSQIAADLGGITRNAVIGKVHRECLEKRAEPTRKYDAAAPAPRRVRAKPDRPMSVAYIKRPPAPAPIIPPRPADGSDIPLSQRRQLLDLQDHHCRWPYGDPGEPGFFFCADPNASLSAGRPYCAEHADKARGGTRTLTEAEAIRRTAFGAIVRKRSTPAVMVMMEDA